MKETRVVIGHSAHSGHGPHLDLPDGFAPLRLRLDDSQSMIEVTCPIAIVGRHSDADLRFAYADISRRHCRLVFEKHEWRIHDLRSLNGIFLNGRSIAEATLLTGDILCIGCVTLLVEAGTPRRRDILRQIADVFPDRTGRDAA